jgi:hypothetical protein
MHRDLSRLGYMTMHVPDIYPGSIRLVAAS